MTAVRPGARLLPRLDQIGSEQLHAIQRGSLVGGVCGLANAAIAGASLWSVVPQTMLLAWALYVLAVTAVLFVRQSNIAARETQTLSARALRLVAGAALLSASPWALLSVAYLGAIPHSSEMILITVCAGMAAGGSVLLAPVYPSAFIYVGAILLPFAVKCFLLSESGYGLLGLLALSYGGFLCVVIATTARLSVERTEALEALLETTRQLRERDNAISTQNSRFDTALNNMTQGLCFFDGDQRLIVCNRRYIDMYGLNAERVQPGISLGEILDMRYQSEFRPAISKEEYLQWRGNASVAVGSSETIHRLENGLVYSIQYRPMADGAWVATTDDITERQALSERLARNHMELGERTALLQAVIENFPGGIGFYDRDLRVAVCNAMAKEILDLPEHFFADGPPKLEDILRFNARRGEYGPGDIEQLVAGKLELICERGSYQFERTRPDGTVLDVRGAPIAGGGFITTYMDITQRYRAEERVAYLAMHDPLTDLPNRTLFRESLDKAVAESRAGKGAVAVLMLDLNRFKQVNDTLGHPVGDALLKGVAERLASAVREEDVVARLGGDEFAVVVRTFDPTTEAAGIAGRIQAALSTPFELGEHKVEIGTSIGIAFAKFGEIDAEQLVKEADVALYFSKNEGCERYRFFEPGMKHGGAGIRAPHQASAA